eukprot:Sspe_Gene.97908::Locus_71400_Transcript_1_1_Confidence_1.000_Length_1359::g.97908::m.97908
MSWTAVYLSACLVLVRSSVGQHIDECVSAGGASVCSAAGQMCIDTSFSRRGDWWCHCTPPAKGAAVGRPAGCGAVPTPIPKQALHTASLLLVRITGERHAALGGDVQWASRAAELLHVEQTRVVAHTDRIQETGLRELLVEFTPPSTVSPGDAIPAEALRRAFVDQVKCCPLVCSVPSGTPHVASIVCSSLGVAELMISDMPCPMLEDPWLCRHNLDCSWKAGSCRRHDTDPVLPAILTPIIAAVVGLAGILVRIVLLRRGHSSPPPTELHDTSPPPSGFSPLHRGPSSSYRPLPSPMPPEEPVWRGDQSLSSRVPPPWFQEPPAAQSTWPPPHSPKGHVVVNC